LWELATGQEIRSLEGHSDAVSGVAYSSNGRHLASASEDLTVRVWDLDTNQAVLTFREHRGKIHGLAFSPDGRRIASGNEEHQSAMIGGVVIWDAANGSVKWRVQHKGPIWGVSFSPDGRYLASASADQTVKVWDAFRGGLVREMRQDSSVNQVAFSANA